MVKKRAANPADPINSLGDRLGFGPAPKRRLLTQALTHPTWSEGSKKGDGDNQRLEFLGDAVLDLLVGEYLYQVYPVAQEGQLSKMRAYIVCEASLAEAALSLGLDHCMRLGHGAELSGDRQRPSVLADAFEAALGAVFVCLGLEKARELVLSQFKTKIDQLQPEDYEDKKSLLQELVQAQVPHGVTYKLLSVSGPDHHPCFESAVYCDRLRLGSGQGHSKKESEAAAAGAALASRGEWLPKIVRRTQGLLP